MLIIKTVQILKVLVGSRAHGLAEEGSDHDHRGVFVIPTSELLKIRARGSPLLKDTSWVEGDTEDATSWEVGKFLGLAIHCNPTILEVFAAPAISATKDGFLLQGLFEHVWHPTRVRDAFLGYAFNQRKKLLDDKDGRRSKYAAALVRVLLQADKLLRRGVLQVDFSGDSNLAFLQRLRRGDFKPGEIVDFFDMMRDRIDTAFVTCDHSPNVDKVNEFLLRVRRENW